MAISPATRSRLSDLIEERRLDIGITMRQVANLAGVSYESIRTLRSPEAGDPRPLTMRGVDRALMWKPGSTARVLYEGGDPDPFPLPGQPVPSLLRSSRDDDETGNGTTGS